jgi:[acyl-carrier-protein] S-malonyltransferase
LRVKAPKPWAWAGIWPRDFPVRASGSTGPTTLGYDLAAVCFEGPESELTKTEHAQPGIYLVGWVAFRLLVEQAPSLRFEAVAGLSLGEFTALAAAGAHRFRGWLRLVRARGRFMQEACEATRGAMAAVIGLEEQPTREVCRRPGSNWPT